LVAEVEGDVGDFFEQGVDAFDKIGEGFVATVAAFRAHSIEAEGAAEVDIPFELAQVIGEVAFVGVGFTAGEITDVEAVRFRPAALIASRTIGTDQLSCTGVDSVCARNSSRCENPADLPRSRTAGSNSSGQRVGLNTSCTS
jgi:hypothetical protein